MTEFAKEIWKRVGWTWHVTLAAIAIGSLGEFLKPGIRWPLMMAVLLVWNAHDKTTYEQDE